MMDTGLPTKAQRPITFPVSSELLAPEHTAKIGDAIWCFLWCVDRTTSEVVRDGERRGRVLGGYVTPTVRISAELGLSEQSVHEQLKQLAGGDYLYLIPRDDGYVIEVRHSVKWLNRRAGMQVLPAAPRGGEPTPMRSLVEGLRERLAAREAAAGKQGGPTT